MLAGAGAALRNGGGETDRAMVRYDHAIHPRGLGRAKQHPEVLRILHGVEHEDERRLRQRVEMQQKLIELHARLALDDRDDALMVLDRRHPRDLHPVDVADENPSRLCLGDELVDRPHTRSTVLRNVEPLDAAARAYRLEDRVRTGDRLPHRHVRRSDRARSRDPTDRLGVTLLPPPRPPAAGRAALARPAAPAGLAALPLHAPLVRGEVAGLLVFLAWERLRPPERLTAELRTRPAGARGAAAELRTGPARAAAATAPATPSSPTGLLVARLPDLLRRLPDVRQLRSRIRGLE